MEYRIEFENTEKGHIIWPFRAEDDNEAKIRYKEFKKDLEMDPRFKGFRVLGLARVEVRGVLIPILPCSTIEDCPI